MSTVDCIYIYFNVLYQVKTKRQRKRDTKATSREIIEDKDDSSGGELPTEAVSTPSQDSFNHKDIKLEENDEDKKKGKKKDVQKKKKKNESGPMHFTANSEPRALDVLGDLEPSIFNEVSYQALLFTNFFKTNYHAMRNQ